MCLKRAGEREGKSCSESQTPGWLGKAKWRAVFSKAGRRLSARAVMAMSWCRAAVCGMFAVCRQCLLNATGEERSLGVRGGEQQNHCLLPEMVREESPCSSPPSFSHCLGRQKPLQAEEVPACMFSSLGCPFHLQNVLQTAQKDRMELP